MVHGHELRSGHFRAEEWFAEQMAPLISREREAATNHLGVSYIKGLRLISKSSEPPQGETPSFFWFLLGPCSVGILFGFPFKQAEKGAFLPFLDVCSFFLRTALTFCKLNLLVGRMAGNRNGHSPEVPEFETHPQ